MKTIAVYSEAGGVGKTMTSVSLATIAAREGKKVVLIDLDPRAATTKWLNVQPVGEGLHVGSILGNADPEGWAEEIAVQSPWAETLRVVPSHRTLSHREAEKVDFAELRLKASLEGLNADLVIIDCPNRQSGTLILSALTAADTVLYPALPVSDGLEGVYGARESVERFRASRKRLGVADVLTEAGIVVCGVQTTVVPRIQRSVVDELTETGMVLTPFVPHRVITQECRMINAFYGDYTKGQPVVEAYSEILRKVV